MIVDNKNDSSDVKNFQYVYYINQKIIFEYLQTKGFKIEDITQSEVCILSYVVNVSKSNYCKSIIIENEQYFFITNTFITNNLIFLNIKPRQLGNRINNLERLGFLKRYIEKNNSRYLKVNDFILEGWNVNDFKFTVIDKIKRFKKHLWETIETNFGSYDEFDLWIVSFEYHESREENEPLEKVVNKLYSYLEICKKNFLKGKRIKQ